MYGNIIVNSLKSTTFLAVSLKLIHRKITHLDSEQFGNTDLSNKRTIFPAKVDLFSNSKGNGIQKKQAI